MTVPNLRTTVKLVPANAAVIVDNGGSFVTLLKTTGNAGDLTINLGNGQANRFDNGDKYKMQAGDSFPNLVINNGSGADITVTIGMGDGDITVSNSVTVSNTITTSAQSGATLPTTADVVAATAAKTALLALNATRKTAIITSLSTNTGSVRIGDTNITAARGSELQPGQTLTLDTTAAIFVRNDTGANQTITLMEVVT